MLRGLKFFNRVVGGSNAVKTVKTVKKTRQEMKKIYLSLSLSTRNPIKYFEKVPLIELGEWFDVSNDIAKMIAKKIKG